MKQTTIISAVIFVLCAIGFLGFTGYNSIQNFQVIQPMSGDIYIRTEGGYYTKFFPRVWEYPKSRMIFFSSNKAESKDGDGLPVRFTNKGTGTVSVQVVVKLIPQMDYVKKLHEVTSGDIGVLEDVIWGKLKTIAQTVASGMSSNEAIENFSKFDESLRKLLNTDVELKSMGIEFQQFAITGIEFDSLTTSQFQKQQEIELARKEAEANKIKFETERDTVKIQYEKEQAESEGKAKVVAIKATTDAQREKELAEIAGAKAVAVAKLEAEQAKVEAEKAKQVAIIEAERNKETAKLNKEAADLDAQRIVALAQAKQKELELANGLSEYAKFALTTEKETRIQVASKVAEALRGMNLPKFVMMTSGGVSGSGKESCSNVSSPWETFANLMNMKMLTSIDSLEANQKK